MTFKEFLNSIVTELVVSLLAGFLGLILRRIGLRWKRTLWIRRASRLVGKRRPVRTRARLINRWTRRR